MRAVLIASLFFSPLLQAESLSEAINKCRQQSDSLERLICYDRVARALDSFTDAQLPTRAPRPAIAQQAAPPLTTAPAQIAPPTSTDSIKDNFGKSARELKASTPDKVYYVIAERTVTKSGKLRFVMENGQVWLQGEKERLPFKAGDTVYIRKGTFGSMHLSADGSKKGSRVKRVK